MRTRSVFSGGVVVLLLALAFALGHVTDHGLTLLEKKLYPTAFSETVEECAARYELDEAVIYALIKETSNFSSNHVSADGKIGLMQLSEQTFLHLTEEQLGEQLDAGMLYEPQTNIRYGCYYLLTLTARYEDWQTIFAAYLCGSETVDAWLAQWQDDASADGTTAFVIPDEEIRRDVARIQRTVEKYHKLYQEKGEKTS